MNKLKNIETKNRIQITENKNNFLNSPDKKELEKIYKELPKKIKTLLSKNDWINYILPLFKKKYPNLKENQIIKKIIESSEKNEIVKLSIKSKIMTILSLEKTINTTNLTIQTKKITKTI